MRRTTVYVHPVEKFTFPMMLFGLGHIIAVFAMTGAWFCLLVPMIYGYFFARCYPFGVR